MPDTQWPRYQVFVQEREGEPHQDAGTVHAPDPELALLNARDVFVRRPACISLWLVPAEAITTHNLITPFEIESDRSSTGDMLPYYIFRKLTPAASLSEACLVTARSPEEALNLAIAHFSSIEPGEETASLWWAFPAEAVLTSRPEDRESLFQPALDKPFRLSTDFKTHTMMRQIKERSQK